MMMAANLVGFAVGLDGLWGLVHGIVGSYSGTASTPLDKSMFNIQYRTPLSCMCLCDTFYWHTSHVRD